MNKGITMVLFLFIPFVLWGQNFSLVDLDVVLKNPVSSSRLLAADGDFNGDGFDDICLLESNTKLSLVFGGDLPSRSVLSSMERSLDPVPGFPALDRDRNGRG